VDGARALARFALDSARARRVAIIYRNDLFGRGFTAAFSRELEAGGADVVERDPYLAGITDFRAYATRASRRGVDALVVAGGGSDAGEIIRALRAAGSKARVLGSDDLASLNDAAGRAEFRGTRFVTFYAPQRSEGEEAQKFLEAYRAKFDAMPTHQAALAVGADRRKVRDRIAGTGTESPPHAGVTGSIKFDPQGDVVDKPVFIGEVQP